MYRLKAMLGLVAALAVSACTPVDHTARYPAFDTSKLQVIAGDPPTEASVRSIYANRTMITFGPHGTQVEFHGTNGLSFLWYPGNRQAVPAAWKVELRQNGHSICWKYPSSSFNPLTQQAGGQFSCAPDFAFFDGLTEMLAGDPFNLATGRVPFPLPKAKFTSLELATKAKKASSRIKTVYRGK